MTQQQEAGSQLFPVDTATDCRDFFVLSTGGKSIPQNKLQRLYVLAFKEARVTGRIQYFMLVPTTFMLANGLAKPMTSRVLMQALSSGFVEFGNEGGHHNAFSGVFRKNSRRMTSTRTTKHFEWKWQKRKRAALAMMTGLVLSPKWRSLAILAMLTTVQPQESEASNDHQDWWCMAVILLYNDGC